MLKTSLQGGGTGLWVPRMDVELKSKYITKSGTYAAKADDCYGFDQVTVSGVDVEITQDDDGNDEADITDGDRTISVPLPSSIVIDQLPLFIGPYTDGQAISFTGMVVKAYMRNGTLWHDNGHQNGIIPISELTLPVTIAHADQRSASSDLDTGSFSQPIPLSGAATFAYTQSNVPVRNTDTWTPVNGAVMVIRRNTERSTALLFASAQSGVVGQLRQVRIDSRTGEQHTTFNEYTADLLSYAHDNKTVYYTRITAGHASGGLDVLISPVVDGYGDDSHDKEAAWTAVYGDKTGGECEVPVQWNRPIDNQLLETSFTITVE